MQELCQQKTNMCSIACQTSESSRCRCSCGGAKHGLFTPVETRLENLKKICKKDAMLSGKQFPVHGVWLDYDDEWVFFAEKDGNIFIEDRAHGALYPIEWFEIYHGIPF